jgi:hypothetical protein
MSFWPFEVVNSNMLTEKGFFAVIPAKAGIQVFLFLVLSWTPAFAGVTVVVDANLLSQQHWDQVRADSDVSPKTHKDLGNCYN